MWFPVSQFLVVCIASCSLMLVLLLMWSHITDEVIQTPNNVLVPMIINIAGYMYAK